MLRPACKLFFARVLHEETGQLLSGSVLEDSINSTEAVDDSINAEQQTPACLMKQHLSEGVSKRTAPGLTEDARTPWERLQHRLGLQAVLESQKPSWCGCSGAPVHADTPLLCTPPHPLPETHTQVPSPCTDQ